MGGGGPRGSVRGDMTPIEDWDRAADGVLSPALAALSGPVYAMFSRDGALFTADMDPEAFPTIGETRPVAALRTLLRAALGFGRK